MLRFLHSDPPEEAALFVRGAEGCRKGGKDPFSPFIDRQPRPKLYWYCIKISRPAIQNIREDSHERNGHDRIRKH